MPAPRSHVDFLELDLHSPMLDEYMRSRELYRTLHAIASRIKAGYVSRVPRDSGNLAGTARVTMHRSRDYRDRRWEAEFAVGNSRVDYADDVEARYHPLGETLRAMGYDIDLGFGDVDQAPEPPRREEMKASTTEEHNRIAEIVDRIQRPGRRPGSQAMERDVRELRDAISRTSDESAAGFGRVSLTTYEALRRAREERDRS